MQVFAKALLLSLAALASTLLTAQSDHVLGRLSAKQLRATADTTWLNPATEAYVPNAATVARLRPAIATVDSVVVYYGSWCGDSKREMPRVLAALDAAGYPAERLTVVGVDNADASYKQSPDGTTVGRGVYRVPTVTLHRGGAELGRLIELPCTTAEADLLAIATGAPYSPNYAVFPLVDSFLSAGLVADENVSYQSLGKLLAPHLSGSSELANVSRVLELEGRTAEALAIARANVVANREDARAWENLAERYAAADEYERARRMVRQAIRYAEGDTDGLLDLLEAYVRAGG